MSETPRYLQDAEQALLAGNQIANQNEFQNGQQNLRLQRLVQTQIGELVETFQYSPNPHDFQQIVHLMRQGTPLHPELEYTPPVTGLRRFFRSAPRRPFTSILRSLEFDLSLPASPLLPTEGVFIPDETDILVLLIQLKGTSWYESAVKHWRDIQKGRSNMTLPVYTTINKAEPNNFFSIAADQTEGDKFAPTIKLVATTAPTSLGLLRFEAHVDISTLPLSSFIDISYSGTSSEDKMQFATHSTELSTTTRTIFNEVNSKLKL